MCDQDRISPYNINTTSIRRVIRIKKNISLRIFYLIQCQILRANIIRIVWHTVRRITNEILGVKELTYICSNYKVSFAHWTNHHQPVLLQIIRDIHKPL